MLEKFNHGYALLIGVGESAYPKWSLPTTVQDVRALWSILTNVDLCAYPDDDEHIRLLHDAGATKSAILDGLDWLKAQAAADPEATVIVYYSGHGWSDEPRGLYYLIPHDVEPFDIPNSGLPAHIFTGALSQIPARRLLVFVDSCHAEGMATTKDTAATKNGTTAKNGSTVKLPTGFVQMTPPKSLIKDLKQGEGRVVFTSCRGEQLSWTRPDDAMSIYTYHLLEALQGAGNRPGDTVVRISNLMNYLGRAVPASALRLWDAEQTPFFDTATEDFPVAVLHGGEGLPAGGWEAAKHEATETIHHIHHVTLSGSGAIALGPEAVSAGERGIAAGRDVSIGKKEKGR